MTRDAVSPFGSATCSPGMRTCKFLLVNVGVSVLLNISLVSLFLRGDVRPPCRCGGTAEPPDLRRPPRDDERIVAAVIGAQNRTAAEALGALLRELGLLRASLRGLQGAANASSERDGGIVRAILDDVQELVGASRAASKAEAAAAAAVAAAAAAAGGKTTKSPLILEMEKKDAEQQKVWLSLQHNVEHMKVLYANFSSMLREAMQRQGTGAVVSTERPHIRRSTYSMSVACRPSPKHSHSVWFKSNFNSTLMPYLTNKTVDLISNDTLRWFKMMQSDLSTLEDLRSLARTTLSLLPPSAPFKRASSKSCLRCAVVGNSGNVKDLRYGTFIDKHNFVFRMNNAPVQCFEHDVGRRTTHRFVYPESFRSGVATGVDIVLLAFKAKDFQWLLNKLPNYNVTRFRFNKNVSVLNLKENKVLVVEPTFMKYVHESWGGKHGRYPSTGFLTTLFALHVCDEVNLFGFGQDRYGSWHHYWADSYKGGAAWRSTKVHDGDYEASVLARLDEEGVINIYRES